LLDCFNLCLDVLILSSDYLWLLLHLIKLKDLAFKRNLLKVCVLCSGGYDSVVHLARNAFVHLGVHVLGCLLLLGNHVVLTWHVHVLL
jgi:PP-loop superfamily ATP-utilizing enzyme